MMRSKLVRIGLVGTGLLGLGALAGCGGTTGFEPESQVTTPGSTLQKLANIVAFNKLFPGAAPLPQTEATVDCPIMEVQDGTASVRTYAGAETNGNVRYGFALGDTARECSKAGETLVLKVGAEGRVLLGPAGSPGSFTVPIRVAVRNDVTQKVVFSQIARVAAEVPAGGTEGTFTYVSDPFSVPFVTHPDQDYTILIGFDQAGGAGAAPKSAQRRR